MSVLIFGAKGFLGQHFVSLYPDAATPSIDIADEHAVAEVLDEYKPDVVINCTGKTGRPNVDWCEDHKVETIRSNIHGPLVLLEQCEKRGIYWVHMSSGCIYEGDNSGTGFTESDPPNFFGSFYSRSKAFSEHILSEFPVLQLRLRMPFDGTHSPRNLLSKLIKYPKVLDAQNSFTYIPEFLEAAKKLIEKRITGVYNVVNPGTMSPYQMIELYKELVDANHAFERLALEDLSREVRAGRSNCVLSIKKLAAEGISMRPLEDVVREALMSYKNEAKAVV